MPNKRPGPQATADTVVEGLDLFGKTMLITGCNSGLGFETMRAVASKGARVIAVARTIEKAEAAADRVAGNIVPRGCDLGDLSSVGALVARLDEPIDVLIANAGIMALPELTVIHGIEAQMFVNHVAHFALVTRLLDRLTPDGRIVVVSSAAHSFVRGAVNFDDLRWDRGYKPWVAYGQSKLANILFAERLSRQLAPGQTSNSLHPGVVDTALYRHLSSTEFERMTGRLNVLSPARGAATQVFLACHPHAEGINGQYLGNCQLRRPSALARDPELGDALWAATEHLMTTL